MKIWRESLETAGKRVPKMRTASKIKLKEKRLNTYLTLKTWNKSGKTAGKRVQKLWTACKIKLEEKCVNTFFTLKIWRKSWKPRLNRLGIEQFRNWTVWKSVAVLIFCNFLIVFNFENMKRKFKICWETCSLDENIV